MDGGKEARSFRAEISPSLISRRAFAAVTPAELSARAVAAAPGCASSAELAVGVASEGSSKSAPDWDGRTAPAHAGGGGSRGTMPNGRGRMT